MDPDLKKKNIVRDKVVNKYLIYFLGCFLHRESEGEDEHHRHQSQGGVLLTRVCPGQYFFCLN